MGGLPSIRKFMRLIGMIYLVIATIVESHTVNHSHDKFFTLSQSMPLPISIIQFAFFLYLIYSIACSYLFPVSNSLNYTFRLFRLNAFRSYSRLSKLSRAIPFPLIFLPFFYVILWQSFMSLAYHPEIEYQVTNVLSRTVQLLGS